MLHCVKDAIGTKRTYRDVCCLSASLIGRLGQALSGHPPLQCRCRSRARARGRPRSPAGSDLTKLTLLVRRSLLGGRDLKIEHNRRLNSASKMARFAGFSVTLFRGVFSYTNQSRARPLPPAGPITLGVPDLTRRTCSRPAASNVPGPSRDAKTQGYSL